MMIAAIDMGGTKTIAGFIDKSGQIHSRALFKTDTSDFHKNLYKACELLKEQAAKLQLPFSEISGIGISLPGMVDTPGTRLVRAVYPGWSDIPVPKLVREYMDLDNVCIENDVNACSMGEMRFGFKEIYRDFLWMTVSTGVGGALVSDGRLIRGAHGCAGEVGHVKVEYEHPFACPCGQLGCLEAHGSGKALDRYIQEALALYPEFSRDFEKYHLEINGSGCSVLAQKGNEPAINIFNRLGTYLGRGIASAVNLLNPEAVIIGGGVSASLELLKPSIDEALRLNVNNALLPVTVTATKLGYDAAFLGAAALVLNNS